MGSNPTQALGVLTFLVSFVLFGAGLAGWGIAAHVLGAVSMAVSASVFLKAKPWENRED